MNDPLQRMRISRDKYREKAKRLQAQVELLTRRLDMAQYKEISLLDSIVRMIEEREDSDGHSRPSN